MSNYKSEFGRDFDLGFNLYNYSWLIDKSWHNDVCPSFYYKTAQGYFILWVDFAEPEKREEDGERYVITKAINEGSENAPEIYQDNTSAEVFTTEEPDELLKFLDKYEPLVITV